MPDPGNPFALSLARRVLHALAFADELIRIYAADMAAALGMDLDPETDLPLDGEEPAVG